MSGKSGFAGGVVTGLTLGVVWAPCVGPIMAAVITLAITESVTWNAVLITLFYSLGTAIPLFAVMQGGRQLLNRVSWLKHNAARVQKAFAVLMLVTAIGIFFDLDRKFQSWILDVFPGYGSALTSLEDNSVTRENLDVLGGGR
jgi:cytochrome c biogenesis protein CcdA